MKQRINHRHTEHFLDTWAMTSGIRDWNAGGKLALCAAALVICIAADHVCVSAVVLFLSLLTTAVPGRRRPHELLAVMRIPALFIVLGSAAAAIELSGDPVGTWRILVGGIWIGVSREGLVRAGEILLKAFAAVGAMYMLTLSTSMEEILAVLRRLHCPALLLELMHMIYRNIFILMQMHARMQTAAQARMGYKDFRTSLRSFGQIGANLFFLSMGRANALYDAMASRGYNGSIRFLEQKKQAPRLQVLWSLAYLGITVSVWTAVGIR